MEKTIIKDSSVKVGNNFQYEHNVVIYQNVEIGDNVVLGNNVIIHPDTKIGDNVIVYDNAVLGRIPKAGATSQGHVKVSSQGLNIGRNVIIGISAIIYRGSSIDDHSFIADLVHIRENCQIGKYVSIGKYTSLEQEVILKDYVKIMACSQVAAWTEMEEHSFMGADVSTCTDTTFGRIKGADKKIVIKQKAMIGSNASLAPGVTIGENAIVGLGAVVLKDVPARKTVFGNPAKVLWDVDSRLLENND